MVLLTIAFIVFGILVVMMIYGLYIVYKGELAAGDSKGGKLKGVPARVIGFMYLLAPVVAATNLALFFLLLHFFDVSIASEAWYIDILILIVTATIFGILFVINKLTRHMHGKQDSNNQHSRSQSSNSSGVKVQSMDVDYLSNEGERVELHKSISDSQTKFLSSWWLLFIFSAPLSLYYMGEFSEFVKPYILLHFDSEDTQGNLFILSIVCYLFSTISLPFFVAYSFLKHVKKSKRNNDA